MWTRYSSTEGKQYKARSKKIKGRFFQYQKSFLRTKEKNSKIKIGLIVCNCIYLKKMKILTVGCHSTDYTNDHSHHDQRVHDRHNSCHSDL